MGKAKAGVITAAIMGLMSALLWLMWDYQVRGFWAVALILAAIGYVSFAYGVYRFLAWANEAPEEKPWGLSMEEADAEAWEAAP